VIGATWDHGGRRLTSHRIQVDNDASRLVVTRQLVHHVEEDLLEDGPQPAGASSPRESLFSDGLQGLLGDPQFDVLELEQALVLLHQRIPGFHQDPHQRLGLQLGDRAHNRQAAHELGDQAELDEVLGTDVGK